MKKHILATATLLLAANTSVFAQQTPVVDPASNQPEIKSYFDFGPSVYLMKMSGSAANALQATSQKSYGIVLGNSLHCLESDIGNVRFGLEMGIYGHSHKIYGRHDYTSIIVPVLIKAGYDFKLSESFFANVGLGVGATVYTAKVDWASAYSSDTIRQGTGTFAFDIGVTYHLSETWKLDLSYKYLANGDIELIEGYRKVSSHANAFAITAGCKF